MRSIILAMLLIAQWCQAQTPVVKRTDSFQRSSVVMKPAYLQARADTVPVKKSSALVTTKSTALSSASHTVSPATTLQHSESSDPVVKKPVLIVATRSELTNPTAHQLSPKASLQKIPTISADTGQLIFQRQCASCHSSTKDLTGPALMGVRQRVPGYVLYAYLRNPDSSVFKSNVYFQNLKSKYGFQHPKFAHLSEPALKSVLSYVDDKAEAQGMSIPVSTTKLQRVEIAGDAIKAGETPIRMGQVRFTFTTDTVMEVGKTYVANLVLTSSLEVLKEQLEGIIKRNHPDSIFTWDTSLIKKFIAADLEAEDKEVFKIEPVTVIGARELDSNSFLKWSWSVKALKPNPNAILVVGLYFSDQKFSDPKDGEHVDEEYHTVEVRAEPTSALAPVTTFISNNWQFLLTAIIIPVFVWWWSNRRKKSRKTKK
jgi:mono/diheme cytochrome c family protein